MATVRAAAALKRQQMFDAEQLCASFRALCQFSHLQWQVRRSTSVHAALTF
jgi:hypothetical protein